jgi:transcriptional regulator with XRE-family HTH domain
MQPETENPNTGGVIVGRRLRELRKMQGLSIRSLAEISGLNFNTLSLIEKEKTSPNVSTLQQLASGLRVPITAFFESSLIEKDVVFQKSRQRPRTTFSHGELEDLGGGLALGEATPLLMTSNPNTNSGPDAIVHTGQEFVYCLEGSLIYQVGQTEYHLEKDDSLIFQAHIPHRWENKSEFLTRSILIICPSADRDRAVEQHLKEELQK